jgi:hypothetical protein
LFIVKPGLKTSVALDLPLLHAATKLDQLVISEPACNDRLDIRLGESSTLQEMARSRRKTSSGDILKSLALQ